jgi:hypothetical protein
MSRQVIPRQRQAGSDCLPFRFLENTLDPLQWSLEAGCHLDRR